MCGGLVIVSGEFKGTCGNSSVGRASASQAEGRGFEARFPLHLHATDDTHLQVRLPVALLALWLSCAQAALPAQLDDDTPLPTLAPILDQATPAVVNIATYTTVQVRNPLLEDPFFRRFFDIPDAQRYRRTQSAGSGVLVDSANGYIVTNNHVVNRADEINVTLADGRTLAARLIGSDVPSDLAVLQVEPEGLAEIRFADSSGLRVGDFVIAIGNPFGLNQTVTSGIVSALGRTGIGLEGYEDFIQTDASINPGNSGGALVNLRGELVGINTAIIAPGGGNVGIGFAIPSNIVHVVMAQLIAHGEVRRGNLGLSVQALDRDLAQAFGVDWQEGVVIVDVEPGSAADAAGVRPGDLVVHLNGRRIGRLVDFNREAAILMVGDSVDLELLRDGQRDRLSFLLPEEDRNKVDGARLDPRLAGVVLQNFRSGGERDAGAGVLVSQVARNSTAWQHGLRPGDVIVAVNRQSARNLSEFRAGLPLSRQLLFRVYRNGEYGHVVIR
jgi:Do/DeqQ family serine protease